ncbi:MAG: 6-phosphogluconolactonase [Lachnospiraceae bacterium]
MNGHLALNEPHAGLDIPARRVKLDADTVRVSEKYFSDGGHAPEYGITLGVPELLGAREVWITIFGEHKRETSRRLLDPETRAEDFPAAAALSLERAVLVFDRAAYPAE